jgi:hypothetical protein
MQEAHDGDHGATEGESQSGGFATWVPRDLTGRGEDHIASLVASAPARSLELQGATPTGKSNRTPYLPSWDWSARITRVTQVRVHNACKTVFDADQPTGTFSECVATGDHRTPGRHVALHM